MKKIDENNKWIIQTVVVSLCFLLFLYLCFFKDLPTQRYDDLWPENGDVIATIDGKEYRYDPVYLYRLTNCVFDEDYRKSSDGILRNGLITHTPTDLLYGSTMAEAAVGLELLFQEGLKHDDANLIKTSTFSNECKEWYDYLPMNRNSVKLCAAHEKAKFYPEQSNEGFVQELEPFLKKLAYINQAGIYFAHHQDEYYKYLAKKYEKYNVKMVH